MRRRKDEQQETFLQFIIDVLINSVVIIVLFFFVQSTIAAPFQVMGNSMVETLQNGEYIVVSKLEYLFGEPERGDIVVFRPPLNDQDYYIKRIIGVPGDTVELKGGEVLVNGLQVEEDYLREGGRTCVVAHMRNCESDEKSYLVPEGKYFVMGDNRSGSSDSRAWHDGENTPIPFVPEDHIQGKTRVVLYPLPSIRVVPETDVFETMNAGDHE